MIAFLSIFLSVAVATAPATRPLVEMARTGGVTVSGEVFAGKEAVPSAHTEAVAAQSSSSGGRNWVLATLVPALALWAVMLLLTERAKEKCEEDGGTYEAEILWGGTCVP